MSRSPRRLLPPTAGRTHVQQIEIDQFARRLQAAMNKKGWSNSDLARAVWGEADATDKSGRTYRVARNRDRVGQYLKGTSFPEPRILAKLAEALDTTAEELAPEITVSAIDRERPEMSMVMVAGHTDKVHMQINALLPLGTAVEISRLVERAKRGKAPVPGVDVEEDE
jgi:transcriptional regulator with XRE-family HTH domain